MMRRIPQVVVLGLALAACKNGCGDRSTGSSGAAPAVSGVPSISPPVSSAMGRDTYPSDVKPEPLAVRLCDALHTVPGQRVAACCGGEPTRYLADECIRVLSTSIRDRSIRVAEPAVDACLAATKKSLEGCAWVKPSQPTPPKECRGVFEGLVAAGGACRSHLDCVKGLHCDEHSTCRAPEAIGTLCGRDVDLLASATRQHDLDQDHPTCSEFCSRITHKCEARPTEGASCFSNVNCAKNQQCIDRKCAVATVAKEGEACTGRACDEGLRCASGKCAPLAKTGEACQTDFDCAEGGCSSGDGGKACGTTCSHAADLPSIMKKLGSAPNAPSAAPRAR